MECNAEAKRPLGCASAKALLFHTINTEDMVNVVYVHTVFFVLACLKALHKKAVLTEM